MFPSEQETQNPRDPPDLMQRHVISENSLRVDIKYSGLERDYGLKQIIIKYHIWGAAPCLVCFGFFPKTRIYICCCVWIKLFFS